MSSIRVFSFNILTDNCKKTGGRTFAERSKLILDEFLAYEPDLIGFQETQPPQRQWLIDNFTDFQVCGVGRDRDLLGESNVVLFRKSRFDLVFLETFWLSDTPRIPGSRFSTDQSDCPRICTCTTLRERESGKCSEDYGEQDQSHTQRDLGRPGRLYRVRPGCIPMAQCGKCAH